MNKLTSLTIAATGATLTVAALYFIKPQLEKDTQLAKKLNGLRDDLELDCDLILSATKEVPEEIITAADRTFKEKVDDAADFATSIFSTYAYLDENSIKKLSTDAKRAYLECLSSLIKNAEKYIYTIDAARDNMQQARRNLGIEG